MKLPLLQECSQHRVAWTDPSTELLLELIGRPSTSQ
jgi:hypothetical protein